MPNDTVTAKRLPVADIVTVTESACKSLTKKMCRSQGDQHSE